MGSKRGKRKVADYEAYLRSAHWQRRRLIAGDAANWTCACGRRATQIHHGSYKNIGAERDEDLHAVCNACHELIHQFHRLKGMTLRTATEAVLVQKLSVVPLQPKESKSSGPVLSPEERKARKALKARKKKRRKGPAKTPSMPKRVSKLALENDRLHELQVRNRERQAAARAARAAPIRL